MATENDKFYTNSDWDELRKYDRPPVMILADRWKVFKLRIKKWSPSYLPKRELAYLIIGDEEKDEKVFVYLLFDCSCNLVTAYRIQKRICMDRELGLYIAYAFLVKMKENNVFEFSPNVILPKKKT